MLKENHYANCWQIKSNKNTQSFDTSNTKVPIISMLGIKLKSIHFTTVLSSETLDSFHVSRGILVCLSEKPCENCFGFIVMSRQ